MKRLLLMCMIAFGIGASAQISLGSGTTTGIIPISSNYGYTYTQQIFTKSELNASAAGSITGVNLITLEMKDGSRQTIKTIKK